MNPGFRVLALSTVPDVTGLRRLHCLPDSLSDTEVAEYAFQRRRATRIDDLLPPHFQQLAAFASAGFENGRIVLASCCATDEARVLDAIFQSLAGLEQVDRWSGQEASLACIRTRAMLRPVFPADDAAWLQCAAPAFGEWFGDAEGAAELSVIARLACLPLARGFHHEAVWKQVQQGEYALVQAEVELRALCALFLRLRQAVLLGQQAPAALAAARSGLRQLVQARPDSPHLAAFEQAWPA
ncbi:hypothetical protein ACFONG_17740 [Uliginosibacterium paludis]|uniref:DUF4123 domain-containing protein n=1 Tax=Uliginosibacterium paludis TaxID=1615952 RepID=A0ABV2CRP4_9RHOO